MTALPARALDIADRWRAIMLELARSLRDIPGLPREIAEAARMLDESRALLREVGAHNDPELFARIAEREGRLAVHVLTALAAMRTGQTLAVLAETVREEEGE